MRRLLQRHYQIKDLSYLNGITDKPTFFNHDADKEEGKEEEIN